MPEIKDVVRAILHQKAQQGFLAGNPSVSREGFVNLDKFGKYDKTLTPGTWENVRNLSPRMAQEYHRGTEQP